MNFDISQLIEQFKKCEISDVTDKSSPITQSIYECPHCHHYGLFVDEGVLMCQNCKDEYGGLIDDNAEWRNYSVDDHRTTDPTRCGTAVNPLLLESSYGTTIGYTKNNYFNHLKQLNNWQSMPYHERSLKLVFDRLTQSGFNSGLTLNIVEFSHKLFSEVSRRQNIVGETKLSRGDIRDGLIAACLFYSCKEYEVSRSPQEIGKICGVDTSDVTRGINLFYELMKDSKSINLNKYITKYSDFIERYCNNLGIDAKLSTEIMALGKKVDGLKILTKNTPQAMACGCIFFIITMYNLGITKTQIADKCDQITTRAKFVCNLCDCVSIGNKGDKPVQDIFTKYGYANCYTDRVVTKKSIPGTLQIKGDGKKNRYVINMFVQFYPGPPKYPNDNIIKRVEWFNNCLDKLLEISNAESISFPKDIGKYENNDYNERYLNKMDDFRKKYYLKNRQVIKIVDYEDKDILFSTEQKNETYAEPISVLRITDIDEFDPDTNASKEENINIIKHINLKDLVYVDKKTIVEPPKIKIVEESKPKPKIGLKKLGDNKTISPDKASIKTLIPAPVKVMLSTPEITSITTSEKVSEVITKISQMKQYEKNPTWQRKISELTSDLDSSWDPIFKDPKIMGLLSQLDRDFEKEMEGFGDFIEILPIPQSNIFNAFKKCKYPPKGVILGQDCYPEQLNQAMGLSFSVHDGVKIPPSLENIFKELLTDIPEFKSPKSGNLTKWAEQDVLLLNAALTVRYKQKESHLKIWKSFTDTIIQLISETSETPIVFMLWGNFAKGKKTFIMNQSKHLILESVHPSPLSANKGGWFGNKHFSKCNKFLIKNKIQPIDWNLD